MEPSCSSSESITRGSLFLISLTILTAWSSSSHWGSRSGRVGKYSLLATLSWTSNNAFKTVKHTGAIIQKIPSRSLWLNAIQKHELENTITNHGSYISSAPALMIFTSRIKNTFLIVDTPSLCWVPRILKTNKVYWYCSQFSIILPIQNGLFTQYIKRRCTYIFIVNASLERKHWPAKIAIWYWPWYSAEIEYTVTLSPHPSRKICS